VRHPPTAPSGPTHHRCGCCWWFVGRSLSCLARRTIDALMARLPVAGRHNHSGIRRERGGRDVVRAHVFAPQDLLLLVLIALFCFGGQTLPASAKILRQGLREFQRASEGGADDGSRPCWLRITFRDLS